MLDNGKKERTKKERKKERAGVKLKQSKWKINNKQ